MITSTEQLCTTVRTNFICNLGRGDPSKLFPRSPRLSFEEACRID